LASSKQQQLLELDNKPGKSARTDARKIFEVEMKPVADEAPLDLCFSAISLL
jgi:hypothetical protein